MREHRAHDQAKEGTVILAGLMLLFLLVSMSYWVGVGIGSRLKEERIDAALRYGYKRGYNDCYSEVGRQD